MRRLFSRFMSDESGATAIEYALIAVGISVMIVAGVQALGGAVKGNFTAVKSGLDTLKH